MKRVWFGAGLLAVLLLGGLLSGRWMTRNQQPLADLMEQAAQAAMAEEWDQALTLSGQAENAWRRQRDLAAAFADHGPMEEIDESFAELKVFSQSREQIHFASACMALSRKLEAMGEAHRLVWWNLL